MNRRNLNIQNRKKNLGIATKRSKYIKADQGKLKRCTLALLV